MRRMHLKRLFVLAGLTLAVAALCTLGLAVADRAQAAPSADVSVANIFTSNYYAWTQNGYSGSYFCTNAWGQGGPCSNYVLASNFNLAFEITATIQTITGGPGVSTTTTFNQLPAAVTNDLYISSAYDRSTGQNWSAAADDFVITTTPGVTITITSLRVVGASGNNWQMTSPALKVNVCFFDDKPPGDTSWPSNVPNTRPLCTGQGNQNLSPYSIVQFNGSPSDSSFNVDLTTPKVYTSTLTTSVGTKWVSVQVTVPNLFSYDWYWMFATYPLNFHPTNWVYLPFVRR